MKLILKDINPKLDLDYDKTFTSEKNAKIRRSLVKELRKDLAPRFHPSVGQLTSWLSCLHELNEKLRKTERSARIDAGCMRIVEYKM